MMRPSRQILEEILVHPERDDLRLEYAVSCAVKDPVHAEHIRRQLELPTWEDHPLRLGWGGGQAASRIAHPFRQLCYDVTVRRGFVDEIAIDPYVFIDRGAELLAMAPIERVVFMPKPLPPDLEPPRTRQRVPSAVPEIMACPHIGNLHSIAFEDSNYQFWPIQKEDFESLLASPHLGRLIDVQPPRISFLSEWPDDVCADYWERAFARPEFRKMISIGVPRNPGESMTFSEGWEGHDSLAITHPTPMSEQGRALERTHGYLPALHLHNRWTGKDKSEDLRPMEMVLAYQRGELPRYPVGARVTDEMYVLPPTQRRVTGNDRW